MIILFYIAIILLSAAFVWHEIKIKSRFLLLNILAKILVLGSIIYLFHHSDNEKAGHLAIIITAKYEHHQLDSVLKIYPDAVVHYSSQSIPAEHFREIIIVGEGLSKSELSNISADGINYLGAKDTGLASIAISEEVYEGEEVLLSGKAVDTASLQELLYISAPWKKDSLPVEGFWQYRMKAEQPGNFLVTINNDIDLPFKVKPVRRLKILIHTSQPSFQINFLKNFLENEMHEVLFFTSVSKDITFRQSVSSSSLSPSINEDNLKQADLLIMDAGQLQKLNTARRQTVLHAVQMGLGLIVLPDKEGYEKVLRQQLGMAVRISDKKEENGLSYLNISLPDHALLEVNNDILKSFYLLQGKGKTGSLVLLNDYYLKLSGQDSLYSAAWKSFIHSVARNKLLPYQINSSQPIIKKDFPYHFYLITNDPAPEISINKIAVPLKQDVYWQQRWEGIFWPDSSGWLPVSIAKDTIDYIYVSDDEDLYLAPDQNKVLATIEFVKETDNIKEEPREQNKFYLWLAVFILLMALGYLWLEPKL